MGKNAAPELSAKMTKTFDSEKENNYRMQNEDIAFCKTLGYINEQDEYFIELKRFPDYYVSNLGRVGCTKRGFTTYILPFRNTRGYATVCLKSYEGTNKTIPLHILVAENLLPKKDNKQSIRHIDKNILNNSVENLEWY